MGASAQTPALERRYFSLLGRGAIPAREGIIMIIRQTIGAPRSDQIKQCPHCRAEYHTPQIKNGVKVCANCGRKLSVAVDATDRKGTK